MSLTKSSIDVNWDAAIEKLASLTEEGQLDWKPVQDFHGRTDERPVLPAFQSEVKGRMVLVYEYEYKYYTNSDEWEWATGIAVEFVDASKNLEYTWQGNLGSRRRLLGAIRYRAAHVDEFLKEFLKS